MRKAGIGCRILTYVGLIDVLMIALEDEISNMRGGGGGGVLDVFTVYPPQRGTDDSLIEMSGISTHSPCV